MSASPRLVMTVAKKDGRGKIPLVDHWAVVINEPPEILVEVVAVGGIGVFNFNLHPRLTTDGPKLEERLKSFQAIGPRDSFTRLTNIEIEEIAIKVVAENPRYSLLSNNCQHFVEKLVPRLLGTYCPVLTLAVCNTATKHLDDDKSTVDELATIVATPDLKQLEHYQSQFAAVNEFLGSHQFPQVEELLNLWSLGKNKGIAGKATEFGQSGGRLCDPLLPIEED